MVGDPDRSRSRGVLLEARRHGSHLEPTIKENPMNHPWQQPIRPLEVVIDGTDFAKLVLFIRPSGEHGWEVITTSGARWSSERAIIREVKR